MNFEDYLLTKKIDSGVFRQEEPALWDTWKEEFDQMHPNSFTAQKLYLINPVRRKYPAKETAVTSSVMQKAVTPPEEPSKENPEAPKPPAKPVLAKPAFKPKMPVPSIPSQQQTTSQTGEDTEAPKAASVKPVMARPVIKPKPPQDNVPASDSASAKTESSGDPIETPPPPPKPLAKPVMPRPVIKPKPKPE